MAEGPQARIRNAQDLLVFFDAHEEGLGASVLDRTPQELRSFIENAGRTTWYPLGQDARFVDAIIATLGPERAEEMWRKYTRRFVETPLQRALFEGARRIFGLNVGSLVKMTPRVWATSFRAAGEIKASSEGPGEAGLHLSELPAEMIDRPGYVILLRGMFAGIYDLARNPGAFEIEVDARARRIDAAFHWEPADEEGPAAFGTVEDPSVVEG